MYLIERRVFKIVRYSKHMPLVSFSEQDTLVHLYWCLLLTFPWFPSSQFVRDWSWQLTLMPAELYRGLSACGIGDCTPQHWTFL